MSPAADSVEPLMQAVDGQEGEEDDHERHGSGLGTEAVGLMENELDDDARPTAFVWILTLAAGVSGLLFGYDTGVISSTLVSVNTDLSNHALTTLDKSLITSSTSLFALLAAPCTGLFLADATGRKPSILLASCLFVIGALWQAMASTVPGMIAARSVIGLAVGSASFLVPLYIAELSPSGWRGRLVTISSLFITGGQVVAYIVGWLFSERDGGWRWMVGLGAVPALVQLLVLFWMPETPRFLVKAGKPAQAGDILKKMYGMKSGKGRVVKDILSAIAREVEEEELATGRKFSGSTSGHPIVDLFTNSGNRRALTITCMLQGGQQLCGFNSLMYFSATIFALVGFTSPTLTSLTIAGTNFVFTVIAFFAIDHIGRRRILLASIPFMIVGLLLSIVAFSYLDLQFETNPDASYDPTTQRPATTTWAPLLLVLSFIVYVSMYALGLGNVPWQQSELFPLRVRSVGSSLATATNWFSNTIVGVTFLPMLEALSPQITFLCYAGVCGAVWVMVWLCYPETAGLGLEEVGMLLERGWGIDESVQVWKRRRRIRIGEQVAVNDLDRSAGNINQE